MIYVIDHQDSFTWNVVHQFSKFDKVYCSNYFDINYKILNISDTIVLSPGPGSPKDYPQTSNIYKNFKGKKKLLEYVWVTSKFYTMKKEKLFNKKKYIMDINLMLK